MANPGTNIEKCRDKILNILRADSALRSYVRSFFTGMKQQVAVNELPALAVNLSSHTETPVTDYPFVVDTTAVFLISGFLEIFDDTKKEWIGGAHGKGLGHFSQDIRMALQGDLNLTGNCIRFQFGETVFTDDYPYRGVNIALIVTLREDMADRVRKS